MQREIVQSNTQLPSKKVVSVYIPTSFLHTFTTNAFPRFLILALLTLNTGEENKGKMKTEVSSSAIIIKGLECLFVIKEGGR